MLQPGFRLHFSMKVGQTSINRDFCFIPTAAEASYLVTLRASEPQGFPKPESVAGLYMTRWRLWSCLPGMAVPGCGLRLISCDRIGLSKDPAAHRLTSRTPRIAVYSAPHSAPDRQTVASFFSQQKCHISAKNTANIRLLPVLVYSGPMIRLSFGSLCS